MTADPAFFEDSYHRLLEPFHPEEEARHEVAALREILGLAQADRVLDVGCGWGRHLRLLHEAGHHVVGVDLSYPLLRRARDNGGAGSLLVVADMRRLPARERSFDAVINLATSLGLFLEDADAATALTEMGRVLRPGGRLLVEGMNGDDAIAGFAERDGWTLDDGTEVRVRRRLDRGGRISHEVLRWEGPGGAGEKRHSLRLRGPAELEALVAAAGLTLYGLHGGWSMEPVGPESERLILTAGR